MTMLIDINRPAKHADVLNPPCNLRVDDCGKYLTIAAGQADSHLRSTILLSRYEAKQLYESLAALFSAEPCIACERRKKADQLDVAALKEHAGLLAIAQLNWHRAAEQAGGLIELSGIVGALACTGGEEDVEAVADPVEVNV